MSSRKTEVSEVRRRSTRTGDTGDRLLRTAAASFRTKGYAATTTRELATALGLQNASIYHHIGKKEDLLYALCVDSMERIRRDVERIVLQHHDPAERLQAMIKGHTIAALTDRDKFATMMLELRSLSEDRRREVLRLREHFVNLIKTILVDAQAKGVIRSDMQPNHMALAWFNLVNWSIFWYREDGDLTPEQIGDMLASIFLNGAIADRQ